MFMFLNIITYILFTIVFRLILLLFQFNKKITIKIKIPKSKNNKNKDFYYLLTELETHDFEYWLIRKYAFYNLKKYNYECTQENILTILAIFIIPYPIIFYKYSYILENSFRHHINDLSSFTYVDLVENYEFYKEKLDKNKKEIKEKINLINKINNINRDDK